MKRHSRDSKVYSVAGKDRSAVLMGGKKADGAFWFDGETGQWMSSRYYMDEYPAWVREFHARRLADGYFGRTWEPLPIPEALLPSMKIEAAGAGAKDSGIPRIIGHGTLEEDHGFYHALFETPFLESYLLAFAESLVREESLGTDEATDVLALGFSSVDSVGHDYGPNSREVLDAIVRLDRELDSFFRFLDRTIGIGEGRDRALRRSWGRAAPRVPVPARPSRRSHLARGDWPAWREGGKAGMVRGASLFRRQGAWRKRSSSGEAVEELVSAEIAACPGVARVWTRSAIESAKQEADPTLLQFTRAFHPATKP